MTMFHSRPKRHAGLLLAVVSCLGAGSLRSQTASAMVPSSAQGIDANSVSIFVLGGFASRTQILVERSTLGRLVAKPIRRRVAIPSGTVRIERIERRRGRVFNAIR